MKASLLKVFALAILITLSLITNSGCGLSGCADVYLEGVTIGSMSVEGKPLSGLPSQTVDVVLNVNANRITISTTGQDMTIKLSPSNAIIVSSPDGINFMGVKPEQIEIKWHGAGTK